MLHKTNIPILNNLLDFNKINLLGVVGTKQTGKTTLTNQIIIQSIENKDNVLYFDLNKNKVAKPIMATLLGASIKDIDSAYNKSVDKFAEACVDVNLDLYLTIIEDIEVSIIDEINKATRGSDNLKSNKNKIKVIVIDDISYINKEDIKQFKEFAVKNKVAIIITVNDNAKTFKDTIWLSNENLKEFTNEINSYFDEIFLITKPNKQPIELKTEKVILKLIKQKEKVELIFDKETLTYSQKQRNQFKDIIEKIIKEQTASITFIQRHFNLGYPLAESYIDELLKLKYIRKNENNSYDVLIDKETFSNRIIDCKSL